MLPRHKFTRIFRNIQILTKKTHFISILYISFCIFANKFNNHPFEITQATYNYIGLHLWRCTSNGSSDIKIIVSECKGKIIFLTFMTNVLTGNTLKIYCYETSTRHTLHMYASDSYRLYKQGFRESDGN